jgi:hypothetical protein
LVTRAALLDVLLARLAATAEAELDSLGDGHRKRKRIKFNSNEATMARQLNSMNTKS